MIREYLLNLLNAILIEPRALWLFVLVGLLFTICLFRRKRPLYVLLIRLGLLSLLIFALADPAVQRSEISREITALFDVSRSISPGARAKMIDALRPYLGGDTDLLLVPFASQPLAETLRFGDGYSTRETERKLEDSSSPVNPGDTNIAAAITRVVQNSRTSSVLLLSDGQETQGDSLQAARIAGARGLRIFPIIPDPSAFEERGLLITALHNPVTARLGEQVPIRVAVRNTSDKDTEAQLELWLDKERLLAEKLLLKANSEQLVVTQNAPADGGLKRIRAVLSSQAKGGSAGLLRERISWVSIKERSKVLLISGTPDDARILRRLLRIKGFALEELVADGKANIPVKFEGYSSVVLNNAARRQLPGGFLPALQEFIAQGGGLLIIGGDRSYGLGGYIDTPLEEVSPVKFVPPQTKARRLTNAVIMLLDKSGSMMFQNKITAARNAVLSAISALRNEDSVGVIGFDAAPFVIIALSPASEAREIAPRRLRNLTAHGKTDLLPALKQARAELKRSDASRKHILILSDGKFPLAGNAYVNEISALQKAGISISTIALGIEADVPFLKLLAKYGKGAFYHTIDPSQLPQIFLEDIKVATGEKTMKEQDRFPIELGRDGLRSTSVLGYPPVRGFVETLPKRGAAIELITAAEEKLFPILASWKYRVGTVVAFTSDANGRWSLPWLNWDGFSHFWGQVVEAIKTTSQRPEGEVDFDLRYHIAQNRILLDLAVFDEKLDSLAAPAISARVTGPGGELQKLAFSQKRKGRFEAAIEHAQPGDYRIDISYGRLKFPTAALTAETEAFGERPGQGINMQTLEQIAFQSGGTLNPAPDQLAAVEQTTESAEHLYVPLLVAAFLLILFEALIREGALSLAFQLRRKRQNFVPALRRPRGAYHRALEREGNERPSSRGVRRQTGTH